MSKTDKKARRCPNCLNLPWPYEILRERKEKIAELELALKYSRNPVGAGINAKIHIEQSKEIKKLKKQIKEYDKECSMGCVYNDKTRTKIAKDFVKFLEKDEYFMHGEGELSEFIIKWERQKKKYNIKTKINRGKK